MIKVTESKLQAILEPLIKKGLIEGLDDYFDIVKDQDKIISQNGIIRIYEESENPHKEINDSFEKPGWVLFKINSAIEKKKASDEKEDRVLKFLKNLDPEAVSNWEFPKWFLDIQQIPNWFGPLFGMKYKTETIYKLIRTNQIPFAEYRRGKNKRYVLKCSDLVKALWPKLTYQQRLDAIKFCVYYDQE